MDSVYCKFSFLPSIFSAGTPAPLGIHSGTPKRTDLLAEVDDGDLMIICAALGLQLPALRSVDRRALRDAAVPAIAAGVLALAPLSSVAAADPKDIDPIGKSIFEYNCAACHRGGQNIIMPEKTLEREDLEQYLDGGFNEKAVIRQVTNGKNAMPAFGGRLSGDDIANVAAYVISTANAGWD